MRNRHHVNLTRPQLFRAARRVIRWSGPVACLLLLFRECSSTQWTSVRGGTTPTTQWESAVGLWQGPTLWTVIFFLLAFLTAPRGQFGDEIASVVIMILKKDNAGVDLDEYIAASKEGFKSGGEIRDFAAVPAKLGRGFFIIPEKKAENGNLVYMNKVNNCLVTITIWSTQTTLEELRKWLEANNR